MSAMADDAPRGFVAMRDYLKLQRRCDELEEQLAFARELTSPKDDLLLAMRVRFKLSPQCAALLVRTTRTAKGVTGRDACWHAIGAPDPKQVDVVACRLNKMLRAFGAPRHTVEGVPYHGGRYLTKEGRAWLRKHAPELFAQGASR